MLVWGLYIWVIQFKISNAFYEDISIQICPVDKNYCHLTASLELNLHGFLLDGRYIEETFFFSKREERLFFLTPKVVVGMQVEGEDNGDVRMAVFLSFALRDYFFEI